MLYKVLNFLHKEGNFSTKAISKSLKLPEPIIDDLKEKLINMGYIKKVICDVSMCEKCSCGCNSKKLNDKADWEITEKGINLLKKIS
ncbi:FeoC-like transcriptional regulator [Clostridium senegalense]|uniref:Transcriptional regulator HTH-type FeoC domain-containing protein n=1 Tax=Clostridium senegalense TaxID=1465809 RepID=A0A6M0H6L8_9CLOT|nr:FeoC-like transcriptional regulator [Clostridium senegalense]NEU06376.1 hypothetical protein [Clostridium senegalense]